jgi:hypothetical protein
MKQVRATGRSPLPPLREKQFSFMGGDIDHAMSVSSMSAQDIFIQDGLPVREKTNFTIDPTDRKVFKTNFNRRTFTG